MSLNEFIEVQKSMEQGRLGNPTTRPAMSDQATRELINSRLGPYRVGVGDVLAVVVTPATQVGITPPVQVRVSSAGTIELPLAGEVKVADMTLEAVEQAIRKAYVPDYHRQAVVYVDVPGPRTTNVLVVRAVAVPGLVPLRRTERNLLFAVAGAGGTSQEASGEVTLKRIRPPSKETTLNLREAEQLKDSLALAPLEDGDIVIVHSALPNMVFVGGLVNAPMPQEYPPGVEVTILQAIAAASGLRMDLIPTEATLIRRIDGKDFHVKLDLDRLSRGVDENIALAAGDILWVPHTPFTRIHEFVNNNVFVQAGVSATYRVSSVNAGAKYHGDLKDEDTLIVP
ncbi:MAG: polysaccharide biosynthesis/export family protein [Planctomycetota bacterium]